jgi:hypothetical protein
MDRATWKLCSNNLHFNENGLYTPVNILKTVLVALPTNNDWSTWKIHQWSSTSTLHAEDMFQVSSQHFEIYQGI